MNTITFFEDRNMEAIVGGLDREIHVVEVPLDTYLTLQENGVLENLGKRAPVIFTPDSPTVLL